MNRLQFKSLISGLIVFIMAIILLVAGLGWLLLWFLLFIPGILYNTIVGYVLYELKSKHSGVFGWIAFVVYIGCFCINAFDLNVIPIKIIGCSTISMCFLFTTQFLLGNKNLPLLKGFLQAMIIGFLSGIPSAISCHFYLSNNASSQLFYMGIFSIYPIWQLSFSFILSKSIVTEIK